MRKLILSSAALVLSISALAAPAHASSQSGTITNVAQTVDRVLFSLSGSRTTMPGCSCCNRWEITGSTTTGQSMLAIVLTAFSLNKAVQITGAHSCVAPSNDTEAITYINIDF